jgi:spermidine/putrescine transport system permease protein
MLVLLPTLGLFYISDILGGAKSPLIGNIIRDQFLVAQNWPFGAAVSVLMILLMAVFLLTYLKSVAMVSQASKKFN